jgi:hypothetical protein
LSSSAWAVATSEIVSRNRRACTGSAEGGGAASETGGEFNSAGGEFDSAGPSESDSSGGGVRIRVTAPLSLGSALEMGLESRRSWGEGLLRPRRRPRTIVSSSRQGSRCSYSLAVRTRSSLSSKCFTWNPRFGLFGVPSPVARLTGPGGPGIRFEGSDGCRPGPGRPRREVAPEEASIDPMAVNCRWSSENFRRPALRGLWFAPRGTPGPGYGAPGPAPGPGSTPGLFHVEQPGPVLQGVGGRCASPSRALHPSDLGLGGSDQKSGRLAGTPTRLG